MKNYILSIGIALLAGILLFNLNNDIHARPIQKIYFELEKDSIIISDTLPVQDSTIFHDSVDHSIYSLKALDDSISSVDSVGRIDSTNVNDFKSGISTLSDSSKINSDSTKSLPLIVNSFHPDSLKYKRKVFAWKLNDKSQGLDYHAVDTLPYNLEQYKPNFINKISTTWLGYVGSVSVTNDLVNREYDDRFVFSSGFKDYLHRPHTIKFYDTKSPFTLFGYTTGGQKSYAEQTLNLVHSQNVNENLNFGLNYDLVSNKRYYGRNLSINNSPLLRSNRISLFTSYIKNNYALHAGINFNDIKDYEFGGLSDDDDIIDENARPENLAVNLSDGAYSEVNERNIFMNQRYRLTHEKIVMQGDTLEVRESIPYLEFGHFINYRRNYRKYTEDKIDSDFYGNNYLSSGSTFDSVYYHQVKNSFSVSYPGIENRNFIATAQFVYNNYLEKYYYFTPDQYIKEYNNTTMMNQSVSGLLAARHTSGIDFRADAELYLFGYYGGDFDTKISASKTFKLFNKKNNKIYGTGSFKLKRPSFFLNEYYSNHFKWTNDFDKESRSVISGGIYFAPTRTNIEISNGLINNYTYMGADTLPKQHGDLLNVLSLKLDQKIKISYLNLDTKLQYQIVSDKSIASVPDLSVISKLYFAKDLYFASTQGKMYMELGVQARYDSEYYAMAYNPSTGLFYQQEVRMLGNYPWVDAYATLRVKRLRFFLLYEHLTQYLVTPNYFTALHYADIPRVFKFGISWSFYD